MKITQDVQDYAATLGDNAKTALSAEEGMAQMSEKFKAMGGEVYVDAVKAKDGNKAL